MDMTLRRVLKLTHQGAAPDRAESAIYDCVVALGYSLRLWPRSAGTGEYPYSGEWVSSVMAITGNWLCITLELSVSATYHVSVDLLTNTTTRTVYAAENVVGETVDTDMLAVFEVKVDASLTSFAQFVVHVSQGTVIRNVDIRNDLCNSTGQSTQEALLPQMDRAMRYVS